MARSRRRSRNREGGTIGTFLAVIAIVAMISGTGAFFYWSYSGSDLEIDEASLCPETGPTAHLAILVDTTDPMSFTQVEAARQQIERKIAEAAVHTRISFGTVNPDMDTRGGTFFSMCKPQSGADASILTQNPQMVEDRFRNEFARPVFCERPDKKVVGLNRKRDKATYVRSAHVTFCCTQHLKIN